MVGVGLGCLVFMRIENYLVVLIPVVMLVCDRDVMRRLHRHAGL